MDTPENKGVSMMIRKVTLTAALLAIPNPAHAQMTDEAALTALTGSMRNAILRADAHAYLTLVHQGDALFTTEHHQFAADFAKRPPRELNLTLTNATISGNQARGTLRWAWRTQQGEERAASFPVTFQKTSGTWRYAGEHLQPVSDRVLAQEGQENVGRVIAQHLDSVYAEVTSTIGFTPRHAPTLKLYDSPETLSATVQLNLKPVGGWNEPGEAIKLAAPRWPASRATLAHELAHHVVFERYGSGQDRIPWWLHEGLAQFVASASWTPQTRAAYLKRASDWAQRDELMNWTDLADFETTPTSAWTFVYTQGYAFVRFAVETHGMNALSAFLGGLADGQDVQDASERALGAKFDAVDAQFRRWLTTQATPSSVR